MRLLSVLRSRPRVPLPPPRHSHYCDECDREWPHEGETCLKHWVWRCPQCLPASSEGSAAGVERWPAD